MVSLALCEVLPIHGIAVDARENDVAQQHKLRDGLLKDEEAVAIVVGHSQHSKRGWKRKQMSGPALCRFVLQSLAPRKEVSQASGLGSETEKVAEERSVEDNTCSRQPGSLWKGSDQ